jgi:hypothetical protein
MLPHEAIEAFLVTKTDMPFYNSISFGQWFSGYGDITLKVSHVSTIELEDEKPLGWYMKAYEDLSSIDIFLRDNTENIVYPNAMYELVLFIQKAIKQQRSLVSDGIAQFEVKRAEDIPIPDSELQEFNDFSIYHFVILVASKYYTH